jgi:hypothetical protein
MLLYTQNSFQAILGTETLGSPKTITNRHNEVTFIIVGDTALKSEPIDLSNYATKTM